MTWASQRGASRRSATPAPLSCAGSRSPSCPTGCRHERLAVASLGVASLALVTLGVARHPLGLTIGAVLLGLGTALLTPAIFALVFAHVPANQRGSAAATTSIFIDLGLTGGPVVIGMLAAAASVPTAFLTSALLPLTGAAVLAAGNRGKRRHVEPSPAYLLDARR